jgi:hypothetical protein
MPTWSHKLPRALELRDGRKLQTLADASQVLLAMTEQRQLRPWNQHAAELLLKAAETGRRADLEAATAQVGRALAKEGML